ncbi:MAG: prepilin peptidase [Syntrophales bacterium]|nr:prepilin peptidase [Syntrophales bacterium]
MGVFLDIVIGMGGAVVGSFLNVCIYRIPEGRSIVFPSSHCPECKHPIKPWDNIPLVSYLILRGRCRHCEGKISLQYPVVELITAVMALLLFWKFGLSLKFLFSFIFICSLIVITFIDFHHQIIPDLITLPGIPLFFLGAVFFMDIHVVEALLGILLGGGILYIIAFVYELLTKREGMGGGDIKLLAMLGAFSGWKSLLFILLLSSFLGALVGITVMIVKGKDMKYAIPFGPFLSFAAVAYIFFGGYFMQFFLLTAPP